MLAEDRELVTQVIVTVATVCAVTAAARGVDRYAVADGDVGDARTNSRHDAGCVTAHDVGQTQAKSGPASEDPEVQPVERGRLHGYSGLARFWLRLRDLRQCHVFQTTVLVEDDCLHTVSLLGCLLAAHRAVF